MMINVKIIFILLLASSLQMSCLYRRATIVEKEIELKEWTIGPGMQTNYITAWVNDSDDSTTASLFLDTMIEQDKTASASIWERMFSVVGSFFKEYFMMKIMAGGIQ